MAINPIVYTERIVRSFLKYQLSAYPFSDPRLHQQMRDQLRLDTLRKTPLLQGPYISLSRGFREGATVGQLISDGVFHPHMRQIIPASITNVYGHQERAVRAVHAGKTTLVSTGTGSGKTECFLYPIISKCLQLKDSGATAGISAVIVYPMNALAEDQLDRLRGLLAGSGIPFGMYVGKTPGYEREVAGHRLFAGSSRADYEAVLAGYRDAGRPDAVHPPEEVCSRERMRTLGTQPRILLTNVKQLELLLTRQVDVDLFADARLDYLVFDEAHTFSGTNGAETACLIRRLRRFCGKDANQTTCVATSATIVDENDPDAARNFASRFFGVPHEAVVTVHEEYEEDTWSPNFTPPTPATQPRELLEKALAAVDAQDAEAQVRATYQQLAGKPLPAGDWKASLFDALRENQVAAQIRVSLLRPRELYPLLSELEKTVGRKVSEEELLCYLTLGAASHKLGRPLLRPVVHAFLRGISGAVVTFPTDNEPKLWLSSEDELKRGADADRAWRPKVHTCTTCGQHYYASFLKDFQFTKAKPEGGQLADGGGAYWEALDKNNGGNRVVVVDQIISLDDDQNLDEVDKTHALYFCRHCGSAAPDEFSRCFGCGSVKAPVKLYAIRETVKQPGNLSSCLSCGARGKRLGRRFREPIREVRAVNVSDVHVLAQDMVHHAQRKRLLVFADNRQDAAFQAGWMKDHARRFRLRSLMADTMKETSVSIGDMTIKISQELEQSDVLSRALIPEVWRAVPKEGTGGTHEDERLHFLRIQVLREVTMAANQQIGLEPWGRMKVTYRGLDSSARFVQTWSHRLKMPPDDLFTGIEALLDHMRRRRLLYDSRRAIFSRYWNAGDREIQRGYLPELPAPQGTKLRAAADDKKELVFQWIGTRSTLVQQIAKKWGVPSDDVPEFLEGLWQYLISPAVALLIPVTLKGSKDRPLPNCSGVYQIDSAKLLLSENHGYYRCKRCRRKVMRRTPGNNCMAWQCNGDLEFIGEDPDNYNLQLLDERYEMLRPEEHTAMVPQEHRERIENWFKGSGDAVNTLVCTQTLELGVDIGALDSVLLRNVPPLPANYWQRAGRAGRRHRMAVNLTYCRPTSHDRAYFNEPTKMLGGRVDPPAFNLRNNVMVAKHVHAAIVTRLNQLARDASLPEETREAIRGTLATVLPPRVSSYLFETTGQLRTTPFSLTPLSQLIIQHRADLLAYVKEIFQQGWPAADAEVATEEALASHIDRMAGELEEVLKRLRRRLLWAFREVQRLNKVREQQATLEQEDEAHFRRCDRLIKKLKGVQSKRRREAEGVDDINTYGVLAAEGFLPGYGLDTGSVVAMAEVPYWHLGSMDFDLPRPASIALREYVPGNLIYANGHRFVARRFHRDVEGEQGETPLFEVNIDREAVCETSVGQNAGALASSTLPAIPVCDVDLMHQSQISDEEETRFQMSVATYGREQGRHNGGDMFGWGERQLSLRRGVHLRLVNVGASSLVEQDTPELGYPVCTVCGQSVSPLASDAQLTHFQEDHATRCGRKPLSRQQQCFVQLLVRRTAAFRRSTCQREGFAVEQSANKLLDDIRQENLAVYRSSSQRLREDVGQEAQIAQDYRGRLIYELLQNADDAIDVSDPEAKVCFRLTEDSLWVANSGRTLDEPDIRGLCGISASSKRIQGKKRASIGHKGMGFKSVLEISDAPEVYSDIACFRFSPADALRAIQPLIDGKFVDPVRHAPVCRFPYAIAASQPVWSQFRNDGYRTAFRFPFRVMDKAVQYLSVRTALESLPVSSLLFLKRLKQVRIDLPHAGSTVSKSWLVARSRNDGITNVAVGAMTESGVYSVDLSNGTDEAYSFIVAYDADIAIGEYRGGLSEFAWDGLDVTEAAVAARVSDAGLIELPKEWRLLHVFLPSAEPCPYDLLISAAFNSNLSRQEIKVDASGSDYNRWLLTNTARLFRDQLIPVLQTRGTQIAEIVRLLRRRHGEVDKQAASAVHEAFKLSLAEFPLVPAGSELPIAVSRCVVPPLVDDARVGRTFRSLLTPSVKHGDNVFPSEQFCGSDLARVLVDHGAYELNVEEAAEHLANADPSRSKLDSHPSDKVFVDPVLSVLEKLWIGLTFENRARLETVVRLLPLFPVAESQDQITRIRTSDVECFYPPRSLKGGVGLSGLCFLMQELCWWDLSPTERNELLAKEMAIWQSLFELREFKFPDVMRASVLPALDLESETADLRRSKLRSSDVLAAVCQLAGRMPDSTKPLPYERLGPNRALFNLSRLDVPCRSENANEPKWVPAYRAYLGEDWVGDASFEKVCKALVAIGETPPDVNFLVGPSYFAGLLDRFRHLEEGDANEAGEEGKDEVSIDEDEEAALDSDEQGRWLTFFRWLGVNMSLRAIHFHDVEDRASGWLTTRNLQKPSGLAFQRIPPEKWAAFVSEVRTKIDIDSSGATESQPYFYQLHDLEHIVQLLEVAARDVTAAVGRAFYEHLCRNWASLERFSVLEIAVVPGEPKRRAKPPRAHDEEIVELDQCNFWMYRLRSAPVCPTGHGPREPSQVWLPTQEVIRRFGRKGRDGTVCLLPTVDLSSEILRGRARGLMQAIGVREELSPASFSEMDAMVVISRLQTKFGKQVDEGVDLRPELREAIRPAYRNVLELLGGGGSNVSDGCLRSAPLLVNDGSGKLAFKTAAEVFYLDRRDTRDRLRTINPLWTFVLEAERSGRNTLVERFGCRILEESLRWMPSVDDSDFSVADKAAWQTHLREVAPYILARVGADRVEETQLRRDAARLRRLVFSLEPVSRIRLKCTLDDQDLFLDAVEREAFVDESSPDGRMCAFVRWGEALWPPTEDDAEALATAFGEVLGPGYFESFLALIRAPDAKREHLLKRAGAPTDIAERRFLLFEDNVLSDEPTGHTQATGPDEPKTVTTKPDSEKPAEQPLGTGAIGDQPKQSPLYSQSDILVDGVPIQLFGSAGAASNAAKSDDRGDSNNSGADQNSDGDNGRGYGGHTDLDRLNALGMAIVMSYELSRLRKAGAPEVTMFDPAHEGPQPNAVVFDVSSPSRIAVARARCSHFDSAFRTLIEAHGVPAEWPGFDVITLTPENKNDPDRLIELKSSGVCARVQDMSWNEWKSARSNQIRQRFYLYLVGNLRTDLNGSAPFVRTIRDPFAQLMAEVLVNRRTERKVQLAVHQFQEAEHLDLTVVKPPKHQE